MLSDWERMKVSKIKEQIKDCDKVLTTIKSIKETKDNVDEIKYQTKYWTTKKKNLQKELKG